MPALSDIASFAVVAGLLTIIPGLDTALVLRTTVTQGRCRGFAVALGINTGCLIWGAAAAAGVSALLIASSMAYDAVRAAGAVYLIWLGITMLWHARRRRGTAGDEAANCDRARFDPVHPGSACHNVPSSEPTPSRPADSALRCWLRGTSANLLNPKVGAFYLAILPQFIPAHAAHLLAGLVLAGIHDAEGISWFALLISTAHLARRFLDSSRAHQAMDRITGTVLISFGVKLALSGR